MKIKGHVVFLEPHRPSYPQKPGFKLCFGLYKTADAAKADVAALFSPVFLSDPTDPWFHLMHTYKRGERLWVAEVNVDAEAVKPEKLYFSFNSDEIEATEPADSRPVVEARMRKALLGGGK
jgi:hypothetical protein